MTTPSSRTNGDTDTEPDTISVGPFTAQWETTRAARTTFVTVQVTNAHTRERTVRIENRLDGDVRPPRRRGVAERGWDTDGVTRTVPAGETVSVGYACDAPAVEPPISLEAVSHGTAEASPVERALRSLDDHAPPRAALSAGSGTPKQSGSSTGSETGETAANSGSSDPSPPDDASPGADSGAARSPTADSETTSTDVAAGNHRGVGDAEADDADANTARSTPTATDTAPSTPDRSQPAPSVDSTAWPVPLTVDAWFRAVDARLDTADRLDGSVADATPVVAALGGRRGVAALETTLERDGRALRAVVDRAAALAARIEETDVPELEVAE